MHKLFSSLKQLLSSTINSALPGGDYDVPSRKDLEVSGVQS